MAKPIPTRTFHKQKKILFITYLLSIFLTNIRVQFNNCNIYDTSELSRVCNFGMLGFNAYSNAKGLPGVIVNSNQSCRTAAHGTPMSLGGQGGSQVPPHAQQSTSCDARYLVLYVLQRIVSKYKFKVSPSPNPQLEVGYNSPFSNVSIRKFLKLI